MVGTGANRTPLTKVHPVLLGKKKGGNDSSPSLLAQHRQQHQDRMQHQQGNPPPNLNQNNQVRRFKFFQ